MKSTFVKQQLFILLSVALAGAPGLAKEKPDFGMTWDQVFAAKVELKKIEDRLTPEVEAIAAVPNGPILDHDAKERALDMAKKIADEYTPLLQVLDGFDNQYNRKQADQFARYSLLQTAYYTSLIRLTNKFIKSPLVGRSIKASGKDEKAKTFVSLLKSSAVQLSRQSSRRGNLEGDEPDILTLIASPTILTLRKEHSFISKELTKRLEDGPNKTYLFQSLSYELDFLEREAESFTKNFNRNLKLKASLAYGVTSNLLALTSDIFLPREHLIKDEMIDALQPKFEPGDIALIRHDYKLTNIGIKGQWAHSIILIGKPETTIPYFDEDAETSAAFVKLCLSEKLDCSNFSSYLQTKYPAAYAKYLQGDTYKDRAEPFQALESKKNGVIFSNIYEAIRKDRLAVMRPNLSKKDRALAIALAFSYVGKKYDYSFDFRSDDKLICTELIVYSYAGIASWQKAGIDFVINRRGKTTITYPEDLVATFARDAGKPNRALNLIVYLREKNGDSGVIEESDEAGFISTLRKSASGSAQELN